MTGPIMGLEWDNCDQVFHAWICAWIPAQVASICMWVTFGGTLSHPTATQINSMRCQSMLTHRGSMFSSYTKGGRWKTNGGTGVRKSLPAAGPTPPSAVIKGEEHLYYSPPVYLPLELHRPLSGPCTDVFCYVSFQTEYLCVWSAALFG